VRSASGIKAGRRVAAAAGVVLCALAFAAGATAAPHAHRRHVEVRRPTIAAVVDLGTRDGYLTSVSFEEPDIATLAVGKLDLAHLKVAATDYGAHFHGSLSRGHVSADFGVVGSVAVRFHPSGPAREYRPPKECEGKSSRREFGRWVGKVSLRGEGGYFAVSADSVGGELDRTFRQRCHLTHPSPRPRPESLRERIEPDVGASLFSAIFGIVSSLEAVDAEGGRVVVLRAAHANSGGPGAEVEAGAFEYQGRMPVGRIVSVLKAPAGSLLTSLPGERPATATLKPGAPFSGEASYLATSPAVHSWTGTLAVRFPGLTVPLAGEGFSSTLCVVSVLVKPKGCEFQTPDWQGGEEATTTEGRR
jgi:hypothetical protein